MSRVPSIYNVVVRVVAQCSIYTASTQVEGHGVRWVNWSLPFILSDQVWKIKTVFALAVMEYAVGVSKFGKNLKTLLVHQY